MENLKSHKCSVCTNGYVHNDSLIRHLKQKHNLDKNYRPLNSEDENTPTLPPGIPDKEFRKVLEKESLNEPQDESISKKRFVFKHPFSMIVSGPTRSGKTQWVTRLLLEKDKRIEPTPNSIFYCYTHWQKKYEELQNTFSNEIRFHKGLPTSILINQLQDAIVVVDDLMDLAMQDKMLMNVFTEGSHHKNISVIYIVQNLYHQGRNSRSINLNAQYLVLFKNPRDILQIQTLARQMYAKNWKEFVQYFEEETSKPYGHVIIDFFPNTPDNERIVRADDSYVEIVKNRNPVLEAQAIVKQVRYPNIDALTKSAIKMRQVLYQPNVPDDIKAQEHSEGLSNFLHLKNTEEQKGSENLATQSIPRSVIPKSNFTTPTLIKPFKSQAFTETPKFHPYSKRIPRLIGDVTPSSWLQAQQNQQQSYEIPQPSFTTSFPTPPDSNMRLAANTPLPPSSSDDEDDDELKAEAANIDMDVGKQWHSFSDTPYEKQEKDKYTNLLRHRREKAETKEDPITEEDIDMETVGNGFFSFSDTPYENQEKEKYVRLLKKHNYDLRAIKKN